MSLRVVGDDDARVEHARRVAQPLQLAHDGHQFRAVLALDERCHDAARAVLGFERAALHEHELDDFLRHRGVACDALGGVEALGEQEVDVAVFRMPEDHGALVAVPLEHRHERLARGQQIGHRHRNIFE